MVHDSKEALKWYLLIPVDNIQFSAPPDILLHSNQWEAHGKEKQHTLRLPSPIPG